MNDEEIFHQALARSCSEERAAYLEQACAGDPAMRASVEALLRANIGASGFMDQPVSALVATVDDPARERPGTVIGPYKLLEQIGEGAFGVVFMAEQTQPLRRKVALKVLKPGMDTRQVIARFEAERQALALMDHPNIARVFDGGETASGRPYFVMELVCGIPITDFCDQNQLSVRERLELFVLVCQAVQHAHQKGIIHRDLKPSNVLVTLHDGTPVVKVIDFGIAKATGQQLTEKTLFTNFAQMIGTPLYMSPEQAGMSGLDVDIRSDIYSLGVLLYELLTGTTPFAKERFQAVGYDEMRRIIREDEPPRPSAFVSTLGQAAATIATQRQSDPKQLSQLFRSELDWIVMKALEKDRNRRYETAIAFAADVQRYLQDGPVQACPPSAWYRLRKFARRNKRVVATAIVIGLILLVAVGAVAGTIGAAVRDRQIRREAVEQEANLALAEADRLQSAGKYAEALSAAKRAEGLLTTGGSDDLRQRASLRRGDLELVEKLAEVRIRRSEEDLQRRFFFDLARADDDYTQAFRAYGVDVDSLEPEEAARRIRERSVPVELAAALDDWAITRRNLNPGAELDWKRLLVVARAVDPDDGRRRLREALERRDQKALIELASADQVLELPPVTLALLGDALREAGALKDAVDFLRKAQQLHPGDFWLNYGLVHSLLEVQPPRPGEALVFAKIAVALRSDSAKVLRPLAGYFDSLGATDDAIAALRRAIRLDPDYARLYSDLGIFLTKKGAYDEAIASHKKAIDLDPEFARFHYQLGETLREQGKLDEAIACFNKAMEISPKDAGIHYSVGYSLMKEGKLKEVVACFNKAVELSPSSDNAKAKELHGLAQYLDRHGATDDAIAALRWAIRLDPDHARLYDFLGTSLAKKGAYDEAIACHKKAIDLGPTFAWFHYDLGETLRQQGKLDEAIACFSKAMEVDPKDAGIRNNVGVSLLKEEKLKEAAACFNKALELSPTWSLPHVNLGKVLRRQGKLPEAIAEYRKAIEVDPRTPRAYDALGAALMGQGKLDEAIAELRKAIELAPNYAEAHFSLGNALWRKSMADDAIAEYREAIRIQKDYAEAHCNLGHVLMRQGKFLQAVDEFRLGHELGSKNPRWPYPSARWLREAERLAGLDVRLSKFLDGEEQPKDAGDSLALAQMCQLHKHLYAAAVRWYDDAFSRQPALADDPSTANRYNAACAAALAGCGQGQDAGRVSDKERAGLRRQARDWLRADLQAWHRLLEKGPHTNRPVVVQQLAHWLEDTDFNGVRGEKALAGLPEAERADWQKLWQEVEALRQRAAGPPGKAAAARR
jgi:tetratricopeptide (TPR) repeat protein